MPQNIKIDDHKDGEAVLSAGRFVPYLTDKDGLSYKSGPLMWSEHRFRDVPGQMGHADYEAMCARLAQTTRWDMSRPAAQCEPGYAAYTRRPNELHADHDQVRNGSAVECICCARTVIATVHAVFACTTAQCVAGAGCTYGLRGLA